MRRQNEYSIVAEGAIQRVRKIVDDAADMVIEPVAAARLSEELAFHEETLKKAFEFRKVNGPDLGLADSDTYFREKLSELITFATMSYDENQRGNYSPEKIKDNVSHYSYLVAKLVAAPWQGHSKRPVSEQTIMETSFEHRNAMERLVNR